MKTGLLIAFLATAALAQRGADDKTSRIDVDNYRIDVTINPDTQTLSAQVAVRFLPLDDQITSATFDFNNALTISRIVDDKGQTLQSSRNQQDQTVRVNFANALLKGQPATITFNYDGRLTGSEESPIYGIKFAAIQNDYA